ncbi:recombinase RecJ [Halomicroarcula sp. S1AR25-4]|uniref:DHH family phosphoesterase n=1 Tax=Haloarcula sp. S1AR25-4 TaxID=2950538 RepID=UPI002874CCA4|nr:recombinase RecJ [Halomicroarcula sp. S1AR25-4]MDS0280339.1 recombinase RecJ [Halomicroarcula sp. S1AR25-4]
MTDDALLDRDELGFEEWAVTPDPDHLVPDSLERERAREAFRSKLRSDPPAVCITHTDADGLSSAALVVDKYGLETVVQPVDYHGAYRFEHVLEDLIDCADLPSTTIVVCDFALDEPVDDLDIVGSRAQTAEWFDHHQWDGETAQAVVDAGFRLSVDEDECTASLLARFRSIDADLQELAEVTKDIDLWIRDDPRSGRLNTFASIADPEDYVATVLECGVDLPDDVEQRIDERQALDEQLEDLAVERAVRFWVGDHDVAVTYCSGGRSSVIGNRLAEEHEDDCDVAVVMKSHGGIGIYSHSDREGFARCHEVASELGGGGHPTAAGCEVPVDTFRDLAHYWASEGSSSYDDIRRAIRAVVKGGGSGAE